jgi:hypothetical protein
MNKPTVILNKRMRKSHYDAKNPITLEFKDGRLVSQARSVEMSEQSDYTFQHSDYVPRAFEFAENEIGDDGDTEFEDDREHESDTAKAYSHDDDEDDMENEDLHNPTYASAKAYLEEDDDLPADRNNAYSDVFEMDDEELFEDTDEVESEQQAVQLAIADEVDVDDRFARDLEAILTGKKSLANLADYTDSNHAKSGDPAKDAASSAEEKMQNDSAIFEKFAASQNAMTSYQLGEVELGSLFDEADMDLDQKPVKKKTLTPEEVRKVVDDNTTVALSDMDFAEDFEIIDSIAEAQQAAEKNEMKAAQNETIEDVVTIEPEEISEK